jgi:RNA polymerase sigma factor (sigma-70 family)
MQTVVLGAGDRTKSVVAEEVVIAATNQESHKYRDSHKRWLLQVIEIGEREGRRVGLTVEEAEDSAMEFLLHALSQKEFPWESLPYVRRSARNAAINQYRKRERRGEFHLDFAEAATTEDVATIVLRVSWWERVHHCLSHLSNELRLVFCRCCLEGESVSAVAASLGKTPNAVSMLLRKSRRQVRQFLEQDKDSVEQDNGPEAPDVPPEK